MSMRNGLVKITSKINPKFYGKKLSTYINSKIPKLGISHISQGNLPTPTLNIKDNILHLNLNIPYYSFKKMVLIQPKNYKTHQWKQMYKKNNFICTKCGVRAIKIKNKNNDLLPKFIILATQNSCCY